MRLWWLALVALTIPVGAATSPFEPWTPVRPFNDLALDGAPIVGVPANLTAEVGHRYLSQNPALDIDITGRVRIERRIPPAELGLEQTGIPPLEGTYAAWRVIATDPGGWKIGFRRGALDGVGRSWCCIWGFSTESEGRWGIEMDGLLPEPEVEWQIAPLAHGRALVVVRPLSTWLPLMEAALSSDGQSLAELPSFEGPFVVIASMGENLGACVGREPFLALGPTEWGTRPVRLHPDPWKTHAWRPWAEACAEAHRSAATPSPTALAAVFALSIVGLVRPLR